MRISALIGLDTTLIIKSALTRDNELMRISALIGLDTTLIIKSALTRDNELMRISALIRNSAFIR